MNALTSTAVVTAEPDLARRAPRLPRGTFPAAAGVALLSAWAFDGGPFGAGFVAVVLAQALALAAASGREGWQAAGGQRWLLASAVALAAFVAVRDSGLLVALDVLASAWLLLLAVRGWNGERPLREAGLGDLLGGPFSTAARSAWRGTALGVERLQESRVADSAQHYAEPVLRTVLLAGPVVGVVTLLLAAGDASFGARLGRLSAELAALPLTSVARALVVGVVTLPLAAGLVAWALRRRSREVVARPAPSLRLGAAESFGLVGGLALVTGLFGLVSAECALAPDACVLPDGVSYAQYAHQGFYELVVAAGIVLAVLLAVPERARLGTPAQERWLRVVATALVGATLPMLLSAFARMALYEEAYGFTRLRVLSQAICVFIALLLAWRALTLWAPRWRFAVGAVASAVACLAGLNALDPDAFIARHNLQRAAAAPQDMVVDVRYLTSLSDDAVPELVGFVRGDGPVAVREEVRRQLEPRLLQAGPRGPLSSLNWSRVRARRLLDPAR